MDEEPLQQAILDAINSVMGNKTELSQLITDTMVHEVITVPKSSFTLGEIQRRLQELESEFSAMLKTAQSNDIEASVKRYQEIKDEMASLKEQREVISDQLRKNAETQERIRNTTIVLDNAVHHITKWEEDIIRQLVHTVKVVSADHIKVILYDGTEIHQEVNNQ